MIGCDSGTERSAERWYDRENQRVGMGDRLRRGMYRRGATEESGRVRGHSASQRYEQGPGSPCFYSCRWVCPEEGPPKLIMCGCFFVDLRRVYAIG